ncbi:MAG TPA: hypothetical protein VFV95_20295 [Vicinamibacterales bacterium]|nr:hypothetical protein [Vicinamibacterales bacterium]
MRFLWSFAIAAAAVLLAGQSVSTQVAIGDLTVPADKLSAGCSLSPGASRVADGRRVTFTNLPISIPSNPWTGTDRETIATIRERMGLAPTVPDLPRSAAEAARYHLELAEGIEEGYAAVYTSTGSAPVVVYALRPNGGPASLEPARSNARDRIEIGGLVARVVGNGDSCQRSIEAHLRARTAK